MPRNYTYGDTIYITVEHEVYTLATDTWALADPTSMKVTIKDSSGTTKVDDQDMDKKATGLYEYLYELPATPGKGYWSGYVDVVNASKPDRKWFGFMVQ